VHHKQRRNRRARDDREVDDHGAAWFTNVH
jgi:hypothetical protein